MPRKRQPAQIPEDHRERWRHAATEVMDDLEGWIRELADAKHEYSVTCRYCHKSFRTHFPDGKLRLAAGQFMIDNGWGRPTQQKTPVEDRKIDSKNMEDLSFEELLKLANLEESDGSKEG